MVTRKTSIPYPASPPPPPPEPSTQPSHHDVDMSTIPPIPQTSPREHTSSNNFGEMGNPWQDTYSPRPTQASHSNSDIPALLRPGTHVATSQQSNSMQNVPEVLRPGWSGEATPRSSLDSDRSPDREWWDDDVLDDEDEDKTKSKGQADKREQNASARLSQELRVVNDESNTQPSPSGASGTVKRKPLPIMQPLPQEEPLQQQDTGASALASNNPFRRPSETFLHAPTDGLEPPSDVQPQGREHHPHPLRSSPSTDRLGQLKLNDSSEEKIALPPPDMPSIAPPPPPNQAPPPVPQLQQPLVPSQSEFPQRQDVYLSSNQDQPPQLSPLPFNASQQHATVSTDELLDRGQNQGSLSLSEELKAIPNAVPSPRPSIGEVSLLEDDMCPPPKPARPPRQESDDLYSPPPGPPPSRLPPTKPPRPAVVTSEVDLAKMREQRNETYQIKHFNWYDMRTSRMRRSSMLTQNKNGPCPLLALVNALILGATEDMQASMDEALRTREQVSLGLIIETLMDELITTASANEGLQLPEIDELNKFLMRLRTGMNANPRFVPARVDAPNLMDADTPTAPVQRERESPAGGFEKTQDIELYSSFNVKLLHGWLPRPQDEAAKAFARSAQSYEDAQAVQFGEEELEYKLSNGGLTPQEQQVWEDITSIKQFFQAYPTQLTPFGLSAVQETLEPGEFAILFRNDHFSTIYKHPRDGRLYTLITDAGYADRDEIIWESLEDINGARTDYFSGDFQSVSHGDTAHTMPHSLTDAANPRRSSTNQTFLTANEAPGVAMTPQEQQEQHDADFAMALQLQEEEEQRMRQARAQQGQGRGGGAGIRPSPPNPRPQRRSGQGNIPIPLRSNPGGEVRPVIPPRNQNQNRNPAVNRPADADQTDAPPAYEEAARTAAYNPPIGSPLHPASSTDLTGQPSTSTSSVNVYGQTTGSTTNNDGRPGQHRRRTSAYGENHDNWRQSSPDYSAGAFGPSYAFMSPTGEPRRRADGRTDRDCNVM